VRSGRFVISLLVFCGLLAPAEAGTLVVLNKSDHEAALVDAATLNVVAKLPTGKGPHEVAISPDNRFAYVANYGSFAIFREGERPRMEPGNTITVMDLKDRRVIATWSLGEFTQPHGIWTSRDGSRVWVTCEGAQAVLELDAKSGEIKKSWKTAQRTSHMLVPARDESRLYVASIGSGTVTIIRRASDEVKSIPTGAGAEGIDITPDGKQVWVTNRGANTVSIIDTATDEVAANLDSGGQFPIRVKFTPDGKQAWVSNARSNSVSVFDVARREIIGKVEVGAVPVGIVISPDGRRAFIANTNDNKVTVIDVAARKVLSTFTTGTEPDGMAWAD
jgi:YVTN family beta-propeller protein